MTNRKKLEQTAAELKAKVAELEKQIAGMKEVEWPQVGDKYWFVDDASNEPSSTKWCNSLGHTLGQEVGNIFRTEQEAQDRINHMKALTKLRTLVPDGWKPDWGNQSQCKFYMYYERGNQEWRARSCQESDLSVLMPKFPTRESADNAIKEMGDQMNDLLKGAW